MARTSKTTDSERRHAFASFKERVDSIRIEPNRKLQKRVHDYVESSFLLAAIEHWKEVNLSGDFIELLEVVEPLCQTLPQIYHHQKKIFDTLISHLDRADMNSIQPVLELMAQFVHDLGPDFLPYYLSLLRLIVRLAESTDPNDSQNLRNSSNILEWCFNCLAYVFKYLSRTLAADISQTFNELISTLLLAKKTYVSRFCAEALSFLVRKLDQNGIDTIINLALSQNSALIQENEFFRASMVTLFSESMKNTKETFHSKAPIILSSLIKRGLELNSTSDSFISIVCDILLDILRHGSLESCDRFINLILGYLETVLQGTNDGQTCTYVIQILAVICFLESGRKISSWSQVYALSEQITSKFESLTFPNNDMEFAFMTCLTHFFVILIRNCPLELLARHFRSMNSSMLRLATGKYYLGFLESSLMISNEKITSLGAAQLVQSFASTCASKADFIRLSLFLARECKENPNLLQEFTFPFKTKILDLLKIDLEHLDDLTLLSITWKVVILNYSVELSDSEVRIIIDVLNSLVRIPSNSYRLKHDAIGLLLRPLSNPNKARHNENHLHEVFDICLRTLSESRNSKEFLASFRALLESSKETFQKQMLNHWLKIVETLSFNLSLPSPEVREVTLSLLAMVYASVDIEFPDTLRQMMLIDQIPLTINNSNVIKMRIRQLFSSYVDNPTLTLLERKCVCHFVFGLLNNQFQPSWLAVYEGLSKLLSAGCSEELWEIIDHFLRFDFNNQIDQYSATDFMVFDREELLSFKCQPSDQRFLGSYRNIAILAQIEESEAMNGLIEQMKIFSPPMIYKPIFRGRAIQALNAVSSLAEKYGSEYIEFVLSVMSNNQNDILSEDDMISRWSSTEKIGLLSVLSKFKNMKNIRGNESLFEMLLDQLTSKQMNIQKECLSVVFAWRKLSINKYKDNLANLLDDKLFREELQSLVTEGSDSRIEEGDAHEVIPVVLRILYGRAKGSSSSNSKSGRKFAVVNTLPSLPPSYIQQFLEIISENINFRTFFQDNSDIETNPQALKSMVGYLNMLHEVYNALGFKFANVLRFTIPPLVYALVCAQNVIDRCVSANEAEAKISKTVRQLGFKCLNTLFRVLDGDYLWDHESRILFDNIVKPRLSKFSQENAQQPSSLMQIMLGWVQWPNTIPFLYYDDFAATRAIMELIKNPHLKDDVISEVLDFCITALTRKDIEGGNFYSVLAIIVEDLLEALPLILENSDDRDINSKASSVLLLIIEGGYMDDNSIMGRLVVASTSALKKLPLQVGINDKVSILLSLASIVDQIDCTGTELEPVIEVCSRSFRTYKDRNIRESLVKVFVSLGNKIPELQKVSSLLSSLNSYSDKRMSEPDFEKRLEAFGEISESLYLHFSVQQWLPLLYCALFFINDIEELALRSNAAFLLMRFVDCFSAKPSLSDADDYLLVFNSDVMPYIRKGLKKEEEQVREAYVSVLAHIVKNSKYLPEFEGMKILVNEDQELDFFNNINDIQITTRQKAIRELIDLRSELNAECIYHYILPITEVYTICKDERYRNLLDDTHETWSYLARCIHWNHYKQLLRRNLSNLSKSPDDELRDRVHLLSRLSVALHSAVISRGENNSVNCMKGLPAQTGIDRFILNDCIPFIAKILRVRNDDTVVARTPLAEAAVNLLMCTSESVIEAELPGTLTSTCQVLRSHTQHLRDAVRKTLNKISKTLGPLYFKFLLKELKSALSRGAQIHVLSYTVHSLLVATNESLSVGDLDDCAKIIADIIMEDIFGASGQDKDAEDYVSKMREVKSKKSYDSGEILSSKISLSHFGHIVDPVKLLLKESLPLKTQRKLNELLRRYALGINHNPMSSSRDILLLCYELHEQSFMDIKPIPRKTVMNSPEDHFLVDLNARPTRIAADKSQYLYTLQKMSLELLRTALGRHAALLTVSNLDGFVPLMEQSLNSDDESLLQTVFRVLDLMIKLPFSTERDSFFEFSASRAFTILQNSPTTASEICQVCLRYLATVVRHKPNIHLSDRSLTVLLARIMPDLEEPDKQSLAFNFLKAVVSQHIMLPEIYDIMEKVATIMVVNHSKEICDMSRSIYFQFLMDYEQGSKKLNSAFKFLVNNLDYPTQSGRQSVMELMHSIVLRSSASLLSQFATSFFVGLSNVTVSDDSAKCREMAAALISQIIKKLGPNNVQGIEKYCQTWISQKSNLLLQRCGLLVYKIYIAVLGYDYNPVLDSEVLNLVTQILDNARSSRTSGEIDWEDVYTSLNVVSTMSSCLKNGIFAIEFEKLWRSILDSLLYPHTWVRLQVSKLIGLLLLHLNDCTFTISAYEIQTIAYRSLRQLSAPTVSNELCGQIIKNLLSIIRMWEAESTDYIKESDADGKATEAEELTKHYEKATDFAITRVCAIMRQESHRDQNDVSKTSAIQLAAMILQVLSDERLMEVAEQFFWGLFNFIDRDNSDDYSDDIVNLARECLKILEERIGITKYTAIHTAVRMQVDDRRQQRRARRAQLNISAPEVAARRKMRKHERFREKRKHEKDENGFYKAKKKRHNRM